jgi:predicted metal-dependent hydrolase
MASIAHHTLATPEREKQNWRPKRSSRQHADSSFCVSPNIKLIFLPEALIDYVLIHELAHTVHLNHGKHFRIVAQFLV